MSLFRSGPAGGRPTPFRPELEALEDRRVLSVSGTQFLQGGTFIVNCNDAADRIVVSDNGTGGVDNITVRVNGTLVSSGRSLWELRLNTGGGNDRVVYHSTRGLTSGGWYHEFEIDLGAGNDSYRASCRGVAAGASGINMYVNGRAGNDSIRADVFGGVASGALGLGLSGGQGVDTIVVDAATRGLDVAAGAVFWANVHGNEGWVNETTSADGDNNVSLTYAGELDGRIAFQLMGAGGSDSMEAELTMAAGSTGVIGSNNNTESARLLGGGGDDDLALLIHQGNTAVTRRSPTVDGGSGFDTAFFSQGRVTVLGVEDSQPFAAD